MITAAAVGKTDSLNLRKYNWEKPQKLVPTPKSPKREKINNNAIFCSMGSIRPKKLLKSSVTFQAMSASSSSDLGHHSFQKEASRLTAH